MHNITSFIYCQLQKFNRNIPKDSLRQGSPAFSPTLSAHLRIRSLGECRDEQNTLRHRPNDKKMLDIGAFSANYEETKIATSINRI